MGEVNNYLPLWERLRRFIASLDLTQNGAAAPTASPRSNQPGWWKGLRMSDKDITVRDGWDPDDAHLHLKRVPYEMNAVRRMQTNGWPGMIIGPTLKMRPREVVNAMEDGMSEENDAHMDGRYIHAHAETAPSPRGAATPPPVAAPVSKDVYVRAKFVTVGDVVVSKGAAVVTVNRVGNDVVLVLDNGKHLKYRPLDELLVQRPQADK